jgi:drug/metabolite transporter (DMT)-like permease
MLVILFGVILVAIPSLAKTGVVLGGGVVIATLSGIAFALYLIFMQLGFKKLHPVPVSVVQFLTILFLTSLSLALPIQLGVSVVADKRAGFLIGSLVLGALTLVGYLANNFGVRYMGAGQASIVASSGPVITALLAAIMIQTQLHQVQVLGILLVTIGVTALSFERMKKMATAPKPTK